MIEKIPGVKDILDDNQAAVKRVPLYIRLPLIILALGLPVYWMIADAGFWRYVNDFQMSLLDGDYFPFVSFFATLFATLIPAVIILKILQKFVFKGE